MSESVKSIYQLIVIAGAFVGALAWSVIAPDPLTWTLRIGCPTAGLLALAVVLGSRVRRDAVPNYLSRRTKKFFSRNGLCFSVAAVAENGVCYLEVVY